MATFFKHAHSLRSLFAQPTALPRSTLHKPSFHPCPSLIRTRYISSTRQLASSKKVAVFKPTNNPPQKTSSRSLPSTKGASASYKSYVDILSSKTSPTLLYQAPSRLLYITGCHILGGFCLAWVGFNFYGAFLHPLAETGYWISVMFGGMCVAMTFFGGYFIMGSYRIIRTITALPSSITTSGTPLLLRLDHASMFPGIRPRSVSVPYNNVILSERLFKPEIKLSLAEIAEIREREREFARSRILTLPFRQAAYWTGRGFLAVRRTMWKEGFIYIQVKGRNGSWKLDKRAAWALDEGRAVDRLVKHQLA